jgi:hypothetical protein
MSNTRKQKVTTAASLSASPLVRTVRVSAMQPTRGKNPPCANPYCNGQDYDSRSRRAQTCLPCGECDHGE